MSMLTTADIHLVDTPRESYRLKLIPWLEHEARTYGCQEVGILGDLTEQKDRHSSLLVNTFAEQIASLAEVVKVYLLQGNHDAYDPNWPFFKFVNKIKNVFFISRNPQVFELSIGRCLFIPHSKDFVATLRGIKDWEKNDFIFTHQTYDGSRAENGAILQGTSPSLFKFWRGQLWSGDIHVPQHLTENVAYVGAPYRVRFGDVYLPRVLLIKNNRMKADLHFDCPMKYLLEVDSLSDLKRRSKDVLKADLVKINVRLDRKDYPEWQNIRNSMVRYAKERAWVLCGIKLAALEMVRNTVALKTAKRNRPEEIISSWIKKQRVDKALLQPGLKLIEEAEERSI